MNHHTSQNSQPYKRIGPDDFVQAAKELVELGWHPLPLSGDCGKALVVSGVTGRPGVDATAEDTFREWAERWAGTDHGLNLGTRMPVGVIALDVDCYDGKPGAETVAACAEKWGDLPPTWSITARDDGSAKLLYRVTSGWEGVGAVPARDGSRASGVEVLQRHHRYAVVPPSIHDVGPVRVIDPDRDECEHLPTPDELPMLPAAWMNGLYKHRPQLDRDPTADPDDLLASFPNGLMTDAVQKAMQQVLDALGTGAGRHDTMNEKLLELLRLGWSGAPGVKLAVQTVQAAFVQALGRERGEQVARGEFERSLRGAAEIVAGSGPSVAHAFQPGGAWHKDSGWIPDGETPGLMKRGAAESPGEASVVRFAPISASELAKPVPPMEWLIRGVWPRHSFGPMGGEKKTLKSYNLLAMAVAIASGEPLFGEFPVEAAGPVVFYVGEGGQAPFQRRLQAISRAYGVDLRDLPLHAVFEVGSLDAPDFTDALKRNLDSIQPELVIIDPLYAFHPPGIEAQNLYDRGRMLAGVSSLVANESGLIIADHFKKSGGSELDLDSIAQAGMGQWADSWILQKHREPADLSTGTYRLAVEFGSRQWGGSRWELDWQLPAFGQLEEGAEVDGLSWDIRRGDGSTGDRPKRGSGAREKRSALLDLINANPFQFTKNQIVDEVGGNKKAVRDELDQLVADRHVEVKKASAEESNGRVVSRDRYGPGPVLTFQGPRKGRGAGDVD